MKLTLTLEQAVYLLVVLLILTALGMALLAPATFMDAGAVYQGF